MSRKRIAREFEQPFMYGLALCEKFDPLEHWKDEIRSSAFEQGRAKRRREVAAFIAAGSSIPGDTP